MDITPDRSVEVAHDEQLLNLHTKLWYVDQEAARQQRYLIEHAHHHPASGITYDRPFYDRHSTWVLTDAKDRKVKVVVSDARPWVEALTVEGPIDGIGEYDRTYGQSSPKAAQARLDAYDAAREARHTAGMAIAEHEKNYTGWQRYFLVTSSAGHVHRTTRCSSCYDTTTFAPLPSLSALPTVDAITRLGSTLCTVCYPDAPVEGKVGKFTAAQAKALVEQGEDAFVTMVEKARNKAAAKAVKS